MGARLSNTAVGFDGRRLVALRGNVRPLFSDSSADRGRMKCQVLSDTAPISWVECAYESEWKGHPMGAFEFTPEVFADVIRIYDADEQPVPFLYGHPRHDLGQAIDAAGWIQAFEVRTGTEGQELWALVEWTDEAAEKIKAGKQRFCSVVIDFAPIDRATGKPSGAGEIFEVGLVPSPFMPGMTPITLSRVGTPARAQQRTLAMATPMDPTKMIEGVAKALGLKKDATPDEIKALIDAVFAFVGAMPGAVKSGPPPADVAAAAAELSRFVKLADEFVETPAAEDTETAGAMAIGKLVTATGLDEAAVLAGLEANLDAIAALITGTPAAGMSSDAGAAATLSRTADAGRIVELAARATTAEARLVTLEAELAQRRAVETEQRIAANFSRLVADGKAGESERATFLKCSAESESITLAQYDARTVVLPPAGQVATGKAAAPPVALGRVSAAQHADPRFASFLSVAKAEGLRGEKANARALVLLSNADRFSNTDA